MGGVGNVGASKCGPNTKCIDLMNVPKSYKTLEELRNAYRSYIPRNQTERAALNVLLSPEKIKDGEKAVYSFDDERLKEGYSGSAKLLIENTDFLEEAKKIGSYIIDGWQTMGIGFEDLKKIPTFAKLAEDGNLDVTSIGVAVIIAADGNSMYRKSKSMSATLEKDGVANIGSKDVDLSKVSALYGDRDHYIAAIAGEASNYFNKR